MLSRHAYKILGLPDTASPEAIRLAWRKKARLFHPDSPYGDSGAFMQAKAAYDVLCPKPVLSSHKSVAPNKQRIRVRAPSRRQG